MWIRGEKRKKNKKKCFAFACESLRFWLLKPLQPFYGQLQNYTEKTARLIQA